MKSAAVCIVLASVCFIAGCHKPGNQDSAVPPIVQNPKPVDDHPGTDTPSPGPAPNLPTNLPTRPLIADAEKPFLRTTADVQALQRALGVSDDGVLGSTTRTAIKEFHAGMLSRRDDPATPSDIMDADSFNAVVIMGHDMPADLKSAFERGFLCNSSDGYRTPTSTSLVMALGVLGKDVAASDATIELLRSTIVAKRKEPGSPPAVGDPRALDSLLYDKSKKPPAFPAAPPPVDPGKSE